MACINVYCIYTTCRVCSIFYDILISGLGVYNNNKQKRVMNDIRTCVPFIPLFYFIANRI